jgi:hypothetical protein
MAVVRFDFTPPTNIDVVEMRIYESPTKDGVYSLIEIVESPEWTPYPNYLSEWTTTEATAPSGWFKLEFVNSKGAISGRSNPIQGGTETLVGKIVERVLLRNPNISENVAAQVAEAVIEMVMHQDPYEVDPATVKYGTLEGMTLFTLAFSIQSESVSGDTEKYTAGLVSQETSSKTATDVSDILKLANRWLGLAPSVVAQMADLAIAGATKTEIDQSRLLLSEFL